MARKRNGRKDEEEREREERHRLHPETKKSIWATLFVFLAILLVLAGFDKAGPAGMTLHQLLAALFGWGYFILPLILFTVAGVFFFSEREKLIGVTLFGATLLVLSVLGLIDLTAPHEGGWLGLVFGSLALPFGTATATIMVVGILLIAILVTLNSPLRIPLPWKQRDEDEEPLVAPSALDGGETEEPEDADAPEEDEGAQPTERAAAKPSFLKKLRRAALPKFQDYVPPPLDLLVSATEKPTTGDLRANANIIKRTLESFGIVVEMGEVHIGPTVTRYTLKPAEGMKLTRITALHQDLALALAAHPIRIEAPIPGKSLVGIEVPNRAAAVVRLGNLMSYPDFQGSGMLGFALGRDVTGSPAFADIERMPHLLIAGATGSGKSVMIHSLLVSLLYKHSPSTLKLILIDPKRVELSVYEHLPHLVSPVITESKKAVGVFRWAIQEMERRYDLLQAAGSRDIKSYNANGGRDNPLPFLVIVVDELADLMTSYGREVEGSIVRLAQMARATGLHLVLSTQRPSVEIITGLIKANITSRIALQVASQIDSRTILDMAGAEKLLGGGDLLFTAAELSKPRRIQGAYISEKEIDAVADFIREHNPAVFEAEEEVDFAERNGAAPAYEDFSGGLDGDGDELYDEAIRVVGEAKKASASLLQRRLKVGYARAARLLDLMEEAGIIGPGEGAKPREVFLEKIRQA
ncbi:MAG: cell division FtsK/SpoIIIE [Parcubacteria group bacterium GW2011_GWB1_56_8]|nr:MAG: cell division FtsK/SpoIIIE [Parcubacteria group bacterium GW2011_GWB1_56_8]